MCTATKRDRIICCSRTAKTSQRVVTQSFASLTKSQGVFAFCHRITAKSRGTFSAGNRPFPKGRSIGTAGYGANFLCGAVSIVNLFISATPSRGIQTGGLVLVAKGCGPRVGSNAFIAKGRSIVSTSKGPFSKSQGTAAGGFRPVAKSYGILSQGIVIIVFLSRTGLGIFPEGQSSFGNSLGSFPKSYRSDAAGSIPFLVFIISAAKGQ